MNVEWNHRQNEEGTRLKLCWSPGCVEGMSKV